MIRTANMQCLTLLLHTPSGFTFFQKMTDPTISQVVLQMMKKTWPHSQIQKLHMAPGIAHANAPMIRTNRIMAKMRYPSTWSQIFKLNLIPNGKNAKLELLIFTQLVSLQAQQRLQTRKGKKMMKKQTAYQNNPLQAIEEMGRPKVGPIIQILYAVGSYLSLQPQSKQRPLNSQHQSQSKTQERKTGENQWKGVGKSVKRDSGNAGGRELTVLKLVLQIVNPTQRSTLNVRVPPGLSKRMISLLFPKEKDPKD